MEKQIIEFIKEIAEWEHEYSSTWLRIKAKHLLKSCKFDSKDFNEKYLIMCKELGCKP